MPMLFGVGGYPSYAGAASNTNILGKAAELDVWSRVLLVRYPSRQHFLAMMANAAYREALVHRYAGLERTILLQMQG